MMADSGSAAGSGIRDPPSIFDAANKQHKETKKSEGAKSKRKRRANRKRTDWQIERARGREKGGGSREEVEMQQSSQRELMRELSKSASREQRAGNKLLRVEAGLRELYSYPYDQPL